MASSPETPWSRAVARVGQAISFSAATVIAAFGTLLLGSLELYRGLGLDLAIAIAFVLVVDLTLLPSLLALFGRAVFWPSAPERGRLGWKWWRNIAGRVTDHPLSTIVGGTVFLGVLALVTIGYTGGLGTPNPTLHSDSVIGAHVVSAHFGAAESDLTSVCSCTRWRCGSTPTSWRRPTGTWPDRRSSRPCPAHSTPTERP